MCYTYRIFQIHTLENTTYTLYVYDKAVGRWKMVELDITSTTTTVSSLLHSFIASLSALPAANYIIAIWVLSSTIIGFVFISIIVCYYRSCVRKMPTHTHRCIESCRFNQERTSVENHMYEEIPLLPPIPPYNPPPSRTWHASMRYDGVVQTDL